MKPVRFHSEALAEFHEGMRYYEKQRAGVGARFREAVETVVAQLGAVPTAYAKYRNTNFRKCLIRKFPYSIFFVEFEDYLWITAVMHQKRRPDYWVGRTPEDG